MFSMIMAIVPSIILLIIMYRLDKKEKEPIPVLIQLFVLGMISIFPVIFVEVILGDIVTFIFGEGNALSTMVDSFFAIALIEESAKFIVFRLRTRKLAAYNCKFDGLVYITFVTLGFATLENIFYVATDGLSVAFMRAVTSIPGHLYFSIYMGYYISKSIEAKLRNENDMVVKYNILALVLPTVFHGIYDMLLMLENTFAAILWFFLVIGFYIFTLIFIVNMSKQDEYFVDPNMWICPKCKATMYNRFCGQCGAKKP